MVENNTTAARNASTSLQKAINVNVMVVQVLIGIFLSINFLLILTFFRREIFYTNARYILFAHTLLADSLFLILTDILLNLIYFRITMPAWLCLIICTVLIVLTFVTPLTLTAMSLEHYVAICMPLRYGELSTPRRAIHCIFIIHSLSSIQAIITDSMFFASVPLAFYVQYKLCTLEMLVIHPWQGHLTSAISQFYFLVMSVTIVFIYVKIMSVAKEASVENKTSTSKGLRTVILHGVQLILCLIQLWCPFVETAIIQIDLRLYIDVRYFNYIAFILAPRCLSPLVYGLRDETFYHALKEIILCGFRRKKVFV
ncbi:odorant receptor 131-2-like [Hypomesus transpacificus]|uniref:odorant receptor 131-2-like n=1 Tax=Hypomesus transpacificus TaxID=137520 RepID=UPI001F078644|nr:odorant receptor 131-2-like [Hypomesus transpacificus]